MIALHIETLDDPAQLVNVAGFDLTRLCRALRDAATTIEAGHPIGRPDQPMLVVDGGVRCATYWATTPRSQQAPPVEREVAAPRQQGAEPSVFNLVVSEHKRQFGDTSTAERAVLIGLLSQAAQKIGSGHPLGGAANPELLTIGGEVVGKFFIGPLAHSWGR
jgi:HAMP domain-containing protein